MCSNKFQARLMSVITIAFLGFGAQIARDDTVHAESPDADDAR